MKIEEILLINSQEFPESQVKHILQHSNGKIDEFYIHYVENTDERFLILTDTDENVAAFTGFIVRFDGRVWQAKNAQTYGEYSGRRLSAKIY